MIAYTHVRPPINPSVRQTHHQYRFCCCCSIGRSVKWHHHRRQTDRQTSISLVASRNILCWCFRCSSVVVSQTHHHRNTSKQYTYEHTAYDIRVKSDEERVTHKIHRDNARRSWTNDNHQPELRFYHIQNEINSIAIEWRHSTIVNHPPFYISFRWN